MNSERQNPSGATLGPNALLTMVIGLGLVLALAIGGTFFEGRWARNQSQALQAELASATPVARDAVSIQEDHYDPASITVAAGSTVTWRNDGLSPHQVTFQTEGLQGSELFGPGGTYAYRFDAPGSYPYLCQLHPYMVGTVIVQ
jgi:plastocyanin